MMRIDILKGTPALSMINGPKPKEQEVTLKRGQRMKVIRLYKHHGIPAIHLQTLPSPPKKEQTMTRTAPSTTG
jgi:hypothetical protein